ncbi:MAG: GUN4 domain-containing protein [Brasilonema octagenarum HA4186-MV1]|jgi:hypothetical protein|nr:GUN4 domain-containing protein [Brasilonema octagenarum HA4186-MV1]
MTHESDEYDDLTQEWGSKPKLVELLCYRAKPTDTTPNKYILEEKYSLENVAIDKLLLVSPATQDDLTSEIGIDYTKLRDLLAARNWKEANDQTYLVMLQAVYREIYDWIRPEEALNFPCTDLRTIDRLWVKYSNGRFGFSVQKKIYLEVGGKLDGNLDQEVLKKFGDRVGWRVKESGDDWDLEEDGVTFDTKSPEGHLPTIPEAETEIFRGRVFIKRKKSVGQLYVSFLSHPDL